MYREIKKKMIILENRKPYSNAINEYIKEMNYLDWLSSFMKLDGSVLERDDINLLMKGGFIIKATLNDHQLVDNYYNTIERLFSFAEMGHQLTLKMIEGIYCSVSGDEKCQYRRVNPVLFALDYNPPHPKEIEEQLSLLMEWFATDKLETNPIMRATILHHRLVEIYPFEEHSETVARMAMYYYLLCCGFPPVDMGFTESSYNDAIIRYLKKEDFQPFYQVLEKAIYQKLELFMNLTKQQ